VRCSPQTVSVLCNLRKSAADWSYGYDLSKATGIKSGTLYPILARLHDEGWLETKWSLPLEPGRPPRHLYRLTAKGAKEASRIPCSEAAKKQFTRLALEG
jgi:DNA-binding PadR family transcriptional regulator